MANSDHLWKALVQDNVPGVRVTSPYPFDRFRALYEAHDTRWFLPKYKIWFADYPGLVGRVVIAQYDPRRGCIEAYRLLSTNFEVDHQVWEHDPTVTIRSFNPQNFLHLDKPVLHLPAVKPETLASEEQTVGSIKFINLRKTDNGEASSSTEKKRVTRFRPKVLMDHGASDGALSYFIHVQPLSHEDTARSSSHFPYSGVWPPQTIPAPHRVTGAQGSGEEGWPWSENNIANRRSDVSDRCFRTVTMFYSNLTYDDLTSINPMDPQRPNSTISIRFPAQVATYATLDPELYTPTPEKPYRGIWVGDYSIHGCEFILVHQPDDAPGDRFNPASVVQQDGENDEDFLKRKTDAMVFRGRLEGIKLTGDPHVPRGELTFSVPDLGEKGFMHVLREAPFAGTRVVKSRGHIAGQGFVEDDYLDSRLLLISHDCIAQYWEKFRLISYFRRVNIDGFLDPTAT